MKFKSLSFFVLITLLVTTGVFFKANTAFASCNPDPASKAYNQPYDPVISSANTGGATYSNPGTGSMSISGTTSYFCSGSGQGFGELSTLVQYSITNPSGTTVFSNSSNNPAGTGGPIYAIPANFSIPFTVDMSSWPAGTYTLTVTALNNTSNPDGLSAIPVSSNFTITRTAPAPSCADGSTPISTQCFNDVGNPPDEANTANSCIAYTNTHGGQCSPNPTCNYVTSTNLRCCYSICAAAATPVNGSCAATHYSCTAGTSANNVAGSNAWTWSCNGSNGGTNASCTENFPPSCSITADYSAGIDAGASNAWAIVHWSSSNIPLGDTVEVTRNNPDGTHVSYSARRTSNIALPINRGQSTYFFYTSSLSQPLCSSTQVSADCVAGTSWNSGSGMCVTNPPPSYTVTGITTGFGSISPSSQSIVSGSTATLTLTPNSGYVASSAYGCGGSLSGNTYTTGTITSDCTVTANFSQMSGSLLPHSSQCIIADGASTCTTQVLTWNTSYPIGTSAVTSATATPSSLSGNSGSQSFTVPFGTNWLSLYNNSQLLDQAQVDASCAVGSNYVGGVCRAKPTITVNACTNGVISPGTSNVIYNSSQSYTISANPGYSLTGVSVDGSSVGVVSSYTFNNIIANHTISSSCVVSQCTNGGSPYPACPCPAGSVEIGGVCTPVTVSVTATTPYNVRPGDTVPFTFTPTTNSGITACRLLDNNQSALTSYVANISLISYPAPIAIGIFPYYVQCRNTTTTSAAATSNQILVNTACGAGTTWNGTTCLADASSMSLSGPATFTSQQGASLASIPTQHITLTNTGNQTLNNITIGLNPAASWASVSPTTIATLAPQATQDITVSITDTSPSPATYSTNILASNSQTNTSTTLTYTITSGPHGTLTASDCIISSGASTCNTSLSWRTISGIGTSNITTPTNITVATGNIGDSTPYIIDCRTTVPAGAPCSRSFYLNNNSQTIATATANATCVVNTTWDGTKCAPNQMHVTCTAVGSGTCSPASAVTNYNSTTSFTITPSQNNNFSISGTCPLGSNLTGSSTATYTTGAITNDCAVVATFTSGPVGTISASPCVIASGASTCNSTVTWSTQYLTSGATEVTRDNPANTHISWLTSGSTISPVSYTTTNFYLYHNISGTPTLLAQDAVSPGIEVTCAASTTWDGTKCAPQVMSGTLTPAVATCTIPAGGSTCSQNVVLSWTTTNPQHVSAVTNNGGATPASPTGNNSSQAFTIPYSNVTSGITTFYLYNTQQLLASATVNEICANGTRWDGSICATVSGNAATVTITSVTPNPADGTVTVSGTMDTGTTYYQCPFPATGFSDTNNKLSYATWTIGGLTNTFYPTLQYSGSSITQLCTQPGFEVAIIDGTVAAGDRYTFSVTVDVSSLLNGSYQFYVNGFMGTNTNTSPTPPSQTFTASDNAPLVIQHGASCPTSASFTYQNGCNQNACRMATTTQTCPAGTTPQLGTYSEYIQCPVYPAGSGGSGPVCGKAPDFSCVPCGSQVMSGVLSGGSCVIASGASSCLTTLSWAVANPEAALGSAVTSNTDNTGGASNNFPIAPPVSTGNADIGTKAGVSIPGSLMSQGGRKFFLYNNAKSLVPGAESPNGSGVLITATCAINTSWDGSKCAPAVGMSGTLSGAGCTISLGGSSCNTGSLAWNVSNPEAILGSAVTSNVDNSGNSFNNFIVAPPVSTGNADIGTKTGITIKFPSRTFFLYNNSNQVNTTTLTASCVNGTVWDGISQCVTSTIIPVNGACATPPNGGTYSSAPVDALCSAGTASPTTLSGNGPWNWTCNGSGGGTNASCSASQTPADACATISANPITIFSGGSTNLNWSAACAATCAGTNFDTGTFNAGTKSVSPSKSTTYEINCPDKKGIKHTASTNVIVKKRPGFQEN